MQIHELRTNRTRKTRCGRGGKRGKTCGRGTKGQKARSGGNVDPLFEGGRSSLVQRMKKKRGFSSRKPKMRAVSLSTLDKVFADGEIVSLDSLVERKVIRKSQRGNGVKITNVGKITKKIKVSKDVALSAAAFEAVKKVGGTVEE